MPHITLPEGVPGIRSIFQAYPETARPFQDLTQILMRGPSPLSPGERELIAAFVSTRNECRFCSLVHGAVASELLPGGLDLVKLACSDPSNAPLSPKLKALLAIAGKVAGDARQVNEADVAAARAAGAVDGDIHDTVLIAALFCMANRYVDGLGAWTPSDLGLYAQMGKRGATGGYVTSAAQD